MGQGESVCIDIKVDKEKMSKVGQAWQAGDPGVGSQTGENGPGGEK
jgi:hypothetical protein